MVKSRANDGEPPQPVTPQGGFSLKQNAPSNDNPVKKVTLTIHSDGFVLDTDNEPRLLSDAVNRAFLDQIQRGELPPSLAQNFPGKMIDLVVKDEKDKLCPKKPKGFSLFWWAAHVWNISTKKWILYSIQIIFFRSETN